jgi:bacterioferritin (cytochrome b1)
MGGYGCEKHARKTCRRKPHRPLPGLAQRDTGTQELLEHLMVGSEEHIEWLETQLFNPKPLPVPPRLERNEARPV